MHVICETGSAGGPLRGALAVSPRLQVQQVPDRIPNLMDVIPSWFPACAGRALSVLKQDHAFKGNGGHECPAIRLKSTGQAEPVSRACVGEGIDDTQTSIPKGQARGYKLRSKIR